MKVFLALMALFSFLAVPALAEDGGMDGRAAVMAALGGSAPESTAEAPVAAEVKTEEVEAEVQDEDGDEIEGGGEEPEPEEEVSTEIINQIEGVEEFTGDVQKELNALAAELGTRTVAETLDALKKEEAQEAAWEDRTQRAADYAVAQVQDGKWSAEDAKRYLETVDGKIDIERRTAELDRREATILRQQVAGIQDRIKAEFPQADMERVAEMAASGAKPEAIKAEAARTHKWAEKIAQDRLDKYLKDKSEKGSATPQTRASGGDAGAPRAQDMSGLSLTQLLAMRDSK
jgi:hypothetical protein